MREPDVFLFHARLVTPPASPVALGTGIVPEVIEDGAIVGRQGVITDLGPTEEILARTTLAPSTLVVDAGGRAAIPGFVDPHTHLLYAGERIDEMVRRRAGAGYLEILKAGGGILDSMRRLRQASAEDLEDALVRRISRLCLYGTVAAEVKSGYGLSVDEELRSLEIIRKASLRTGFPVVPTILGAHAFPPDVGREDYVEACLKMGERAAKRGLAAFADVFCEEGVFTVEESRRILEGARAAGLGLKLHADEIAPSGGAELAAELGAASADHLTKASDEGLRAMAEAGVIAVLLPGTSFCLGAEPFPAARARQHRLVAALATDSNPGSSPVESMAMISALAFHEGGFAPGEILCMTTVNAAAAIGMGERLGSLSVGKDFSVLVLDDDDERAIVYRPGSLLTWALFERGRRLVAGGRLTEEVASWKIS